MPDVARQDAARACFGPRRHERAAIAHLRLASRVSPPSRRAFHLWTLGSVLYLSGPAPRRHRRASRAARWGTTDRPLYQAQLALSRLGGPARRSPQRWARELRERLADAPCGQGYGQFVLGELAFHERDRRGCARVPARLREALDDGSRGAGRGTAGRNRARAAPARAYALGKSAGQPVRQVCLVVLGPA